jgi:enolase
MPKLDYVLDKSSGEILSRQELLQLYRRLTEEYPIVSIEDGFAEDDWDGFRVQTAMLGSASRSSETIFT